ncbi:S-adenosyl-L-methionine-dependent methyltransferase [Aspergillus cavernicola]|uniref:S-adenosyl-L-methionine-dependent methyltransferase n=1 Tax=Aspergillus cavernicola TaxID=176166 RepID=A0ABR4HNW2_9EURO
MANVRIDDAIPLEIAIDEDVASVTATTTNNSEDGTSLASSVLQYEFKYGRRYHGYQAGSYAFPNDEPEQDRLDMVHHVYYRALHNRLILAPFDPDGKRILDIGTGTGIWAIALGDQYPGAKEILGIDLSPIQPAWVPANVRFLLDDVEKPWVPSTDGEGYDFIHCRYMAGSIKDWPRLIQRCFENLKPGGWLELQETRNRLYSEDGSLKGDSYMVKMMEGLIEACEKIGRTMDPAPLMEGWVRDAGFEKVVKQTVKLPVGVWPKDARLKECGALLRVNFIEGVEGFTAALFGEVLGWPREEVEALNAGVRAESLRNDIHPIFDFDIISAQKGR